MANIRKRGNKWQVQVRRLGIKPLVKSFLSKKDAEAWARHSEILIDRGGAPQRSKRLDRAALVFPRTKWPDARNNVTHRQDHSTVVLPIHDSFIAYRASYRDLEETMHRCYRQHMGSLIDVELDYSYAD
jgi:hypothetical protein